CRRRNSKRQFVSYRGTEKLSNCLTSSPARTPCRCRRGTALGAGLFKSFKTFNRFAPFKTFEQACFSTRSRNTNTAVKRFERTPDSIRGIERFKRLELPSVTLNLEHGTLNSACAILGSVIVSHRKL